LEEMPEGLTARDAFGLGLALTSVIFSALMRVYMKWSEAKLSVTTLASWGYLNAVPFALLAPFMEISAPHSVPTKAWREIDSVDILVVAAFSVFILIFANFAQVFARVRVVVRVEP